MTHILVGHNSFYLREGWIKKGIEYLKKDNSEMAFSKTKIKAVDELGIGSVMVQSLKFWLNLLDIMKKEEKQYIPKRNIEKIIEGDPYFQNKNILWLLHSYIFDRDNKDEIAILWDIAINSKKINVFTKGELSVQIDIFFKENGMKFSKRSVEDSIAVFLKTYYGEIKNEKDPETNMYSPFNRLNYLQKNIKDEYYFRNISSTEISEYLVYYFLYRITEGFKHKTIEVNESYNFFSSMIKMKHYDYEKLIGKLENRDFISIDRAGGLANIIIKKELTEEEIIDRLLESETI